MLLLVLLCLIPCAALAGGVELVPADRMLVFPVEGLSTSERTLFRDGCYEMQINDAATRWADVLTYGGYTDKVRLNLGVKAPAGADSHIAVVGSFASDDAIRQALSGTAGIMKMKETRNSRVIAAYAEEHGVVSPITYEPTNANGTLYMAVKWLNSNGTDNPDDDQVIRIEKMAINLHHQSMQGRSISPVKLSMNEVQANATNIPGVTVSLEDGQVTFYRRRVSRRSF